MWRDCCVARNGGGCPLTLAARAALSSVDRGNATAFLRGRRSVESNWVPVAIGGLRSVRLAGWR